MRGAAEYVHMTTKLRGWSVAAVLAVALLSGCQMPDSQAAEGSPDSPKPDASDSAPRLEDPPESIETLQVDLCDDRTFLGVDWSSETSAHFVLYYLPGTAAERDLDSIIADRERAYGAIHSALGLEVEPMVEVYLSPNRVAATARGLGRGTAYPGQDRLEVVYTGAADSFEAVRYGYLLTHVLAFYLDPDHPQRLPILAVGLAEYFDQAGRDQHAAYALNLNAGVETRTHVASFDSRDPWGKNYGRAGSLVQFLIERYGLDGFLELHRAGYVAWQQGCYRHPDHGCVSSPEALTEMLDRLLVDTVGERWTDVQPMWAARVQAALAQETAEVSVEHRVEIENLVGVMDAALSCNDWEAYRSTMDGFYCDWGGEQARVDIAMRSVAAFDEVTSEVVAVYPTGIKNFSTAIALVQRRESRGVVSTHRIHLEHFPIGWRATWGPDWE